MARRRDPGGVGGGQGVPGFLRRIIRQFQRQARRGPRRTQCWQWDYRCEWVDPDSGARLTSGLFSVVTRSSTNYQRASAAARRLARGISPTRTEPVGVRRGMGNDTFTVYQTSHPNAVLRCARVGQPFAVPGPC